jgi:hypothetical protein
MRPSGEVRVALFRAAVELTTASRGATLAELAQRACVGAEAARRTVNNMTRSGELEAVRARKVEYRNKPVMEYAPAVIDEEDVPAVVDLGRALAHWVG